MKPYEVIMTLESDNSRLFKESTIKKQAVDNNVEFFTGSRYALDSMISFGVKNVPTATSNGDGITWDEFQVVADKLSSRQLTGHAARDEIIALMKKSTVNDWNYWYKRILLKDLRCGVGEKTINTVCKKEFQQFNIPVFSVQLAFDSTKHEKKLTGIKGVESKLDGVRFISIVYPTGHVLHYSRNGKELTNFSNITFQFNTVASELDQPYVFDGEIMSNSFQDLMTQVNRKKNVNTSDSILYLFDMIPLKDFQAGICNIPQRERTARLQEWGNSVSGYCPNISVLGQEEVDFDSAAGLKRFNELNEAAIEGGYEGLLIKDIDAPYELKRSHAWLKIKPVITVDLQIIGFEEGTGRNEGRLGALICSGIDADRMIVVNCGSGFSDEQRDTFWRQRESLIGQMVEIKADAVTKDRDGSYSLRFPRFKTFRDDK